MSKKYLTLCSSIITERVHRTHRKNRTVVATATELNMLSFAILLVFDEVVKRDTGLYFLLQQNDFLPFIFEQKGLLFIHTFSATEKRSFCQSEMFNLNNNRNIFIYYLLGM